MKVRLVHNWRNAWRWYSNIFSGLGFAMVFAWSQLDQTLKDSFSKTELVIIAGTMFLLIFLGRMVSQTSDPPPDRKPPYNQDPPCSDSSKNT